MKERTITINGTKKQVVLTHEEVAEYRFLAVDKSGEIWLFESEPHIESPHNNYWMPSDPDEASETIDSGQSFSKIGDAWVNSLTPINIVFDPDTLADTVEAVIRAKYSHWSDHIDTIINDVKALIKAGY